MVIYITAPLFLFVTFWLIVSLRRGEFNIYTQGGGIRLFGWRFGSDWDTAQYRRRQEPWHYWTAVCALAAFDLFCVIITFVAIAMGVAW